MQIGDMIEWKIKDIVSPILYTEIDPTTGDMIIASGVHQKFARAVVLEIVSRACHTKFKILTDSGITGWVWDSWMTKIDT